MSLIAFRLDGQVYATALEGVREVVRLEGLRPLPGAEPPITGLIDLRGEALPVLDARRPDHRGERSDVLIVVREQDTVGVACDGVLGVLPDVSGVAPGGLPPYVISVLPVETLPIAGGPLLLVDLWGLVAALSVPRQDIRG